MRGATAAAFGTMRWHGISIHAHRAGRDDGSLNIIAVKLDISIHAPHAGRDEDCQRRKTHRGQFQSTRPMRGATTPKSRMICRDRISIHAPHAGRDIAGWNKNTKGEHFNPRAPCGARRRAGPVPRPFILFQSTRPMRGATVASSIILAFIIDFNPRAPCGARPHSMNVQNNSMHFNPRAPCGARPTAAATPLPH